MKKSKRLFLCLLALAVTTTVSGCGDDSDSVGSPIHEDVLTTRDERGVWYITGPKNASLYEVTDAMGYAVATDRLWQLEQYRRTGGGRLSEILGSSMLSTDVYIRTMAYSEDEMQAFFDAQDPETQDAFRGYADGINRRIAEVLSDRTLLPYEFKAIDVQKLLKFDFTPTLEDWTALELWGWLVVLLRNFDPEAQSQREIDNAALLQELQDDFPATYMDMFNDLRWINDPDALTYIPGTTGGSVTTRTMASVQPLSAVAAPDFPDLRKVAAKMAETRNGVVESLERINAYVKMGSYAWVVSADKTASGNPILYSGPQMGFDVPSIVVEGSIRAGGLNVSGMTVPGSPGILLGRTSHHAWSMQVGHANTVDYYIEDPSDVFLHRTEIIKVLGEDDVALPVYRTSHGPVISPMPYEPATYDLASDGPIIAWKYSHWGHEFEGFDGFIGLNRAKNMDSFGEAIEDVPVSQHFCYADRDGNIGYWMSGRDPVRPAGEWRFPQGFMGPHQEWDSEILIARSTDRNTSQGFYSGWNNKSRPSYDAGYGPFHRANVIHDYLSSHEDLTFEDLRDLALNIATTDSFGSGGNPWKFVEDYFTGVVAANPTQERTDALSLMAAWDGHFVNGGESAWALGPDRADAWVLMDAWLREVIRLTFEDELGSSESRYTLFNVLLHGLPGTTINNSYDWFQNLTDMAAPQTAEAIVLSALDNALADLGARPWGTGARGKIVYNHPVLEAFSSGIVHTMLFSSRSTYAHCVEYASAGPTRIESMFPLGESGNISTGAGWLFTPVFDPNFLSMTDVYDGFAHRPFPLFD